LILCQITDLHIKAGGRKSYRVVDTAGSLRRCIDSVMQLKQRPDAVVLTGDLVDSGEPQEYAFLRELLQPLTMPYYLLPGNHDERGTLRAAFPDHAYLQGNGYRRDGDRVLYAIDDFPLRIVALDTVVPGAAGGVVDAASLAWLDRTLRGQPEKPTVIAMHHPPFITGIGYMDEIGLENAAELERLVRRHSQVERIICGHLHRPIHTRFGGTIASTCPSVAHQVVLDLDANAPSLFVMEPPAYQLHWWQPDAGLISHTAYVGEFDGPYPFYDGEELVD
jgi:Icc protein